MSRKKRRDDDLAGLDQLIEEITAGAFGDNDQLWALRQAFQKAVSLPADGFVIGEPVTVLAIDYDGNKRRGLTAKCRRVDGSEHLVSAADVVFPETSCGSRYAAAYRKWLGVEPRVPDSHRKRPHKAEPDDVDLSRPVELIALSVKERAVRCRLPRSERLVTLRAERYWDVVPGEIVTVRPRKLWRYGGHPYLSGEIESKRLDVSALGLVPLELEAMGMWDPEEEYWGEENEPIEEWAKPIIGRGARPEFEMEQVLPGEDLDDPLSDPIIQANELKDAGDPSAAEKILMELCESDLRCLDAHAHLGNLAFDHRPEDAIRHYEVGFRVGELSLGDGFDGVLLWGRVNNRPFLRCMNGYGLCLWRMRRFEEAERVFERMLWFNPSDNQGVRFLIEDVRARRPWADHESAG